MPNILPKKSKSRPQQASTSGAASVAIANPLVPPDPLPHQQSGWPSTVHSGGMVALDILKESSDWFGPLKAAVGGLSALITHYQRSVSNKQDAERILRRLESLEISFATPPDDTERERRNTFIQKLGPISEKLASITVQGRLKRLAKNIDQAQEIASTIEDIREAITDYQTSLQQAIYKNNCQLMESADRTLLRELPHSKEVGYLSQDERGCMAGTRIEVLQVIEAWAEDHTNHRVYWLNGVAGTGKSAISRTLAKRIFAGGNLGASFFCSRDYTERNDLHLIFPTLAYDLAHRYSDFRADIIKVIRSSPNVGHESLSNQLEKLLVEPLKRTGLKTVIIIDALDECKEPDNQPASVILSLLSRHINEIPSVKFFITGRPELRIRTGFRLPLLQPHTEVLLLHEIDRTSVDRDIEIFLRDGLSRMASKRSSMDETIPWPEDGDVLTLVQKSSGLFIYADTVLKFVNSNHETPDFLLQLVTKSPDSTIHEGPSHIDSLYIQVLGDAYTNLGSRSSEIFKQFREVVGTTVLLFNPLSQACLAKLLDKSLPSISASLWSLHSLLLVPSSDSVPIRVFHKSFPDYITDNSRCQDERFYVDPAIYHMKIAKFCFTVMQTSLKKNICDLPRYAMNSDVSDLSIRRKEHIGDLVEYACRFWARHLKLASRVDNDDLRYILKLLKIFLERLLLYWFEVLSIINHLRDVVYALHEVRAWLAVIDAADASLFELITDAERFILYFFELIEESAPHIYVSALPWSPKSSPIRNMYKDHLESEVKVLRGLEPFWDSCIRSISTELHEIYSVTFSHKGDLIAGCGGHGVQIFEAATGVCLNTLSDEDCHLIAFSMDDTLLASASRGGVLLLDLQTGGLIRVPMSPDWRHVEIRSFAFSPCAAFFAYVDDDNTIQIRNTYSGSCDCVLEARGGEGVYLNWSRRNGLMSSSLWILSRADIPKEGYFDPETAVWPRRHVVKYWDVSKRICERTINCGVAYVSPVAFSPSSSTVAFVSHDKTVRISDASTGELIRSIPHQNHVRSIDLSPNGDRIVYASGTSVHVSDLTQNIDISTFSSGSVISSVAFSPDGNSVVSGSENGVVNVWSTNQRPNVDHPAKDNTSRVWYLGGSRFRGCEFSPDLSLVMFEIVSLSLTTSQIWSVNSGDLILEFGSGCYSGSGSEAIAYCADHHRIAFADDGKLVASYGDRHGMVKVWDGNTGALVHTFNSVTGDSIDFVALSPDSSLLAASSSYSLQIWNINTGELRAVEQSFGAQSFCFSPDGTRIAVCAVDKRTSFTGFRIILLYDVSKMSILAERLLDLGYWSDTPPISFFNGGTGIATGEPHRQAFDICPASHSNSSIEVGGRIPTPLSPFCLVPSPDRGRCTLPLFGLPCNREWILRQDGARVCWVPPDQRDVDGSRCRGKKFAMAGGSSRVVVFDFSNVPS